MFRLLFLFVLLQCSYISHCDEKDDGLDVSGDRNPLHATIALVQEEERKIHGGILSLDQTQFLLDSLWNTVGCSKAVDPVLCQGCLDANELFRIINANVSFGLQEGDFERASVVILHHLENGVCNLPKHTNYSYVDYLLDIMTIQVPSLLASMEDGSSYKAYIAQDFESLPADLSFSVEQFHYILDLIKDNYKPRTVNKCFTSKGVFEDVGLDPADEANESDVEKISSVVIANLLRGDCIGESQLIHPKIFAESIFENYGTFGKILEHDFDRLLADLDIGGHNDGTYVKPSWREFANTEHGHDRVDKPKLKDQPEVEDTDHRIRRAVVVEEGESEVQVEVHLEGGTDTDHHEDNLASCYTYSDLLQIHDLDGSISNIETFNEICPALIEQIVSGDCEHGIPSHEEPDLATEVYGWATLAVFFVTMCSMAGIIFVPLASVRVYTGLMHLLVALAVSTLSGDALIHLIPEALGLHTNIYHQHQRERFITPEEVLFKVMTVVVAIYAFFLFERIMVVYLGKRPPSQYATLDKLEEPCPQPNYSPATYEANALEMDVVEADLPQFSDIDHLEKYSAPTMHSAVRIHTPEDDDRGDEHDAPQDAQSVDSFLKGLPDSTCARGVNQYQTHELTDTLFVERTKKELSERTSFSFTKGIDSVSIMLLIGDAVHNLTDGIAIGVAFTLDIYVGISTCIAVFCHELPHEIGDFAVLLKNGLSFKTAFFWSSLCNTASFVGVYIGIALGSQDVLHQWIFAATAGMFLYIALVDLMPLITHDPGHFNASVFIMHNIGLVAGWMLMVLLAYFENVMNGVVTASQKPIPV